MTRTRRDVKTALRVLDALLAREADESGARSANRIERAVAEVLFADGAESDPEAVRAAFERGAELLRRRLDRSADRSYAARSLLWLLWAGAESGVRDDPWTLYEESAAIRRRVRLPRESDVDRAWFIRFDLAMAADALAEGGRWERSARVAAEAVQAARDIPGTRSEAQAAEDLDFPLQCLRNALIETGDLPGALRAARELVDLARFASDEERDIRRERVVDLSEFGYLLWKTGERAEAKAVLLKAQRAAKAAVREDPADARSAADLRLVRKRIARLDKAPGSLRRKSAAK